MSDLLIDLASRLFIGPVWPASILALLLVIYAILGVFGLLDMGLDSPEFGANYTLGADLTEITPFNWDFLEGIGGYTIRWTNFGRLPIIVWGGCFTVAYWGVSYGLWHQYDFERYGTDWLTSLILSIRNVVIAVGITKACTQPLLKFFCPPPIYGQENLLGEICVISTSQADGEFGQAEFMTTAAPLLLNIRTDGPMIPKGSKAMIVDFEPKKRIYIVTPLQTEHDT